MGLVEQQRCALADIREIIAKFVRSEIETPDFVVKYRSLFAPFDPPDLTTDDLTEAERRELGIYIQIMGGWFGEDDDLVPKRPDWKYGTDTEPYSWIDGPAYRKWILELLAGGKIVLDSSCRRHT